MSNLKQVVEMERILCYIMEHLEEELPISQVADDFHYNEAYFAKKFSEYFYLKKYYISFIVLSYNLAFNIVALQY